MAGENKAVWFKISWCSSVMTPSLTALQTSKHFNSPNSMMYLDFINRRVFMASLLTQYLKILKEKAKIREV